MVFNARAAGISGSIASITPQRMPMSRFPRNDWLGSSTSPPLITRSNLSVGPIAAAACVVNRPDNAAAAEPVSARKLRRDNADMLALPKKVFLSINDAPAGEVAQAADASASNAAGLRVANAPASLLPPAVAEQPFRILLPFSGNVPVSCDV